MQNSRENTNFEEYLRTNASIYWKRALKRNVKNT